MALNVYLVGGAVRDQLLGLPVHDKDWVVVGATPQQMLDAGYKPVGKDFPVFLHPQTHEEVALARTERKTGKGYQGFSVYADPDVTLEEDLARRDLTINAIAQDEKGQLVDPYNGQQDLHNKVLRHVTEAFAEDPVRILRVARFMARYDDFSIAPQTMQLMQKMVSNGEVDALVAERIWQELAKGLVEKKPSRMFETLQACGALARILPSLQLNVEFLTMLDLAATLQDNEKDLTQLSISFSLFAYALPADEKMLAAVAQQLRAPIECKELLQLVAKEPDLMCSTSGMKAQAFFELLKRCDAIRQPDRFKNLIQAVTIATMVRTRFEQKFAQDTIQKQKDRIEDALGVVLAVDTAPIAQQAMAEGKRGAAIGDAVDAVRIQVLQAHWAS